MALLMAAADVAAFLRSLGLSQLQPTFEEQSITMDLLPEIAADASLLKELGIKALGDRLRFVKAVRDRRFSSEPEGGDAGSSEDCCSKEPSSTPKSNQQSRIPFEAVVCELPPHPMSIFAYCIPIHTKHVNVSHFESTIPYTTQTHFKHFSMCLHPLAKVHNQFGGTCI